MAEIMNYRLTIWIASTAVILTQLLCTVFVVDAMMTNRRRGDRIVLLAEENQRMIVQYCRAPKPDKLPPVDGYTGGS